MLHTGMNNWLTGLDRHLEGRNAALSVYVDRWGQRYVNWNSLEIRQIRC
jgi:hypothetical protein